MESTENGNRNLITENAVIKNKLQSARKEGVTKGALISGITGLVILIVAGIIGYSLFTKEQERQTSLMEQQQYSYNTQLTSRDSIINNWLLTFDEIEKDLNLIKEKENIITVKSSDSEFTKDRRQQVLEDISSINALLETNKKKIASLTAQLNSSGNTIKGLQTMVASLEATIKQYEADVTQLKETLVKKDFEISQLNTNVADLKVTVSQKEETINGQIIEMNEAYITSGTYKELKERGIVSKEGGFLGIGRTEALVPGLNDGQFSLIDLRETKMIPVNSKDAKLISTHPSDSYELVRENEKLVAYIEIKDPEQFWKYSKYAVVEIVK